MNVSRFESKTDGLVWCAKLQFRSLAANCARSQAHDLFGWLQATVAASGMCTSHFLGYFCDMKCGSDLLRQQMATDTSCFDWLCATLINALVRMRDTLWS